MNKRNYLSHLPVVASFLMFGIIGSSVARAEASDATKNEEVLTLQKTYDMLKWADRDYGGHRAEALRAVESACKELGFEAEAKHGGRKSQGTSDEMMSQAEDQLKTVKDAAEGAGQDRLLKHVNKALEEIRMALEKK